MIRNHTGSLPYTLLATLFLFAIYPVSNTEQQSITLVYKQIRLEQFQPIRQLFLNYQALNQK